MVGKVQIPRSNTPGSRPPSGLYGHEYVNFADNQFGVFDPTNTARDLLGVPIFSTLASYGAGQPINYQGKLYVANTAVPAGVWNPAQWTQITGAGGTATAFTTGGQLTLTSATALKFAPFKGGYIIVNGVACPIPAAGITIPNTSVLINGVSGTLAANTSYYVYLANISSVLTPDFSATTHVPSATSGNVGTEIKSGDDTRSLIGFARTNASAQFQDDNSFRGVVSWFNRSRRAIWGTVPHSTVLGAVAPFVAVGNAGIFINFADEVFDGGVVGFVGNDANTVTYWTVMFDGTGQVNAAYVTAYGASAWNGVSSRTILKPSEGSHNIQTGYGSGGGNTYAYLDTLATIGP